MVKGRMSVVIDVRGLAVVVVAAVLLSMELVGLRVWLMHPQQ